MELTNSLDNYNLLEDEREDGVTIMSDQAPVIQVLQHHFMTTNVFPELTERVKFENPPPEELQIPANDLTVAYETTGTLSFVGSGAGYKNTVGHYTIATDGTITGVEVAFENLSRRTTGSHTHEFNVSGDGSEVGIFLIANGYSHNKKYKDIDFSSGKVEFIYDRGGADERLAKVTDSAKDISLIYTSDSGAVTTIRGRVYHTSDNPENDKGLNPDGHVHAISGLADENDPSTLRIGFEDLYNLGDRDYNDVMIDLSFETVTIELPPEDVDDILNGTAGDDVISGGGGNDTINGNGGDDELIGNEGADIINGGTGNDKLNGNNDDDQLFGDEGDDFLNGGSGHDELNGGSGNDEMYGAGGNDVLNGGSGIDRMFGGNGRDILNGGSEDDLLFGEGSADTLNGDDGNDLLFGGGDHDILNGGEGDDTLHGDAGRDIIDGGSGSDEAFGGDDDDTITLGSGNDRAEGGGGDDTITGDDGDDLLYGQDGNDSLSGGAGDDIIYGGIGNDTLYGGEGLDIFYGEDGRDTFTIEVVDGDVDQIRDFSYNTAGERDFIDISNVLDGYDPSQDDISDFALLRYRNSDRADLFINRDGTGNDWEAAAIVRGDDMQGVSASDLFDNGTLVVVDSII